MLNQNLPDVATHESRSHGGYARAEKLRRMRKEAERAKVAILAETKPRRRTRAPVDPYEPR